MAAIDTPRARPWERHSADLLRRRADIVRLVPAAGVLMTWTAMMPGAGGYATADHLPAGLVLLGLLVLAMLVGGRIMPVAPPARVGLGCFAAFVAWNFLSITWSDAPGAGWEASDSLLVTLLGGWTLALAPWRAATASVFAVAFGVAAALVCGITLMSALGAGDLTGRFTANRFNQPLDYPNTSAAFTVLALLPLIAVGARRDLAPWKSALCQAAATSLFAVGLLAESRGALVGLLAAFVTMLVLAPNRWRLGLRMVLLVAPFPLVDHAARDVFNAAVQTGRASAPLHDAAHVVGAVVLAAFVLGGLLALLERRFGGGEGVQRRGRVAGLIVGAFAAVALVGVIATHAGSIRDTASDQWHSLRHPGIDYAGASHDDAGTNRLYDTNPRERYDYWRVSADGLRAAPIGGMGAGGFAHRYVRDRRYSPFAKYPHNLIMSVAGDNGIVGLLLMAGLAAALSLGLLRGRRRMTTAEATFVAVAGGVLVAFFVHGEFDWLEAYPVLTGPVLGLGLMALVVRGEAAPVTTPAARSWRRLAPWALVAIGGGAAAAALALPWVAGRYVDRAKEAIATAPQAAYADLRRAADTNPLDPGPLNQLGSAALVRGDLSLARSAFSDSIDREDAYLGHFGLALVAQRSGDHVLAVREAQASLALNRASPQLRGAVRDLEAATASDIDAAGLLSAALTDPVYVNTVKIS